MTMITQNGIRILPRREVSKGLKASIKKICPYAQVSVLSVPNHPAMPVNRDIDVFIKNFNRIPVETMNKIAAACRSHQGIDEIYGVHIEGQNRRWLLSGEVAQKINGEIKVTWKKDQQMQLAMFVPEEVILECDRINLYIGKGTCGSFTQRDDFSWILENFGLDAGGYAFRHNEN